ADNRPPMVEKDMYDLWKNRMELYMLNRPHGRMILESVEQEYQLADLFTKALLVERFQYLVRRLGMRCLTPAELEALANEPA
nr:retrovirus-related Pol polyprotein from transposon TNT 1-94 [Tanacetum cinerariifolium]